MNIAKHILRGAATQFGREFGRAGANAILGGSNAIKVEQVRENLKGRVKESDNELVVLYKELKKVKFGSTNKTNLVKLRKVNYIVDQMMKYQVELHSCLYFTELSNLVQSKWEEGLALIDDDYEEQEIGNMASDISEKLNSKLEEVNKVVDNYKKEVEEKERIAAEERAKRYKKRKRNNRIMSIMIGVLVLIIGFLLIYSKMGS